MGNFWGIALGLVLICFGIGAVMGIQVWRFFFPTLIILFGFSLLLNQLGGHRQDTWKSWKEGVITPTETYENTIEYDTVFGGSNKKIKAKHFKGGKVSSVFGATVIDLREATMASSSPAHLEVNSVFGGTKVIVPSTWSVEGSLSGVFGGFSNKAVAPEKPEGKLIIKGAAVFGGGEIVN